MSQENNDLRTHELLAQEGLESIGQKLFNTINIETYLLSKKVNLSGIYSTNGILKLFNISLDREATKDTEMKEKVK